MTEQPNSVPPKNITQPYEPHFHGDHASLYATVIYVCAFCGLLVIVFAISCFHRRIIARRRRNRQTRDALLEMNSLSQLVSKRGSKRSDDDSSDLSDCAPVATQQQQLRPG